MIPTTNKQKSLSIQKQHRIRKCLQ